MSTTLSPQTRIRILSSPIADVVGREGTIEHEFDGGYAVLVGNRVIYCEAHEIETVASEQLHTTTP